MMVKYTSSGILLVSVAHGQRFPDPQRRPVQVEI